VQKRKAKFKGGGISPEQRGIQAGGRNGESQEEDKKLKTNRKKKGNLNRKGKGLQRDEVDSTIGPKDTKKGQAPKPQKHEKNTRKMGGKKSSHQRKTDKGALKTGPSSRNVVTQDKNLGTLTSWENKFFPSEKKKEKGVEGGG